MRAAFTALVLLAACSNTPEQLPPPQLPQRSGVDPLVAARAAGVDFRADGPGFELLIYRENRITLTRDGDQLSFPRPRPVYPRWNGEIYATRNDAHELSVEIRHTPCTGAAGEILPARVRVTVDNGPEMQGCGRSL